MKHRRCWNVALAALAVAGPALSQCTPDWSSTFGVPGAVGTVAAVAVHDDGGGPAVYVGGSFIGIGALSANNVARWNGSTWSALGAGMDMGVTSLATFDDGFGPDLYAGGFFFVAGTAMAERIARWNGTSWAGLGGNTGGFILALVAHTDASGSKLFAAGNFTTIGSVTANRIASWNGTTWSALGTGIANSPTVRALASFDDGTGPAVFAGGDFGSAGGIPCNRIAKWNGTAWSTLGSGMSVGTNGNVYALTVWDDGGGPALYAGGVFTTAGGVSALRIAKWDGSTWSALGSGLGGACHSLCVFDDGTGPALYAGGTFATAGGMPASGIARWNGSTWSALGSGLAGGAFGTDVLALAAFDFGTGPSLCLGGSFTSAGGFTSNNLARWVVPGPIVDLGQPGGPGTGSVLNSALIAGHEYFTLFSLEACGGGVGTGPYLGLCVSDVTPLLAQLLVPPGNPPFHFIASGPTSSLGPVPVPPGLVVEAVCFDFTGLALGCWSPVDHLVVQ